MSGLIFHQSQPHPKDVFVGRIVSLNGGEKSVVVGKKSMLMEKDGRRMFDINFSALSLRRLHETGVNEMLDMINTRGSFFQLPDLPGTQLWSVTAEIDELTRNRADSVQDLRFRDSAGEPLKLLTAHGDMEPHGTLDSQEAFTRVMAMQVADGLRPGVRYRSGEMAPGDSTAAAIIMCATANREFNDYQLDISAVDADGDYHAAEEIRTSNENDMMFDDDPATYRLVNTAAWQRMLRQAAGPA